MHNPPINDLHPMRGVLRTAFLGVKPADQVMLKGYLRIILSLDVDLEWVSADHSQIDLYFIDNNLRNSEFVIKLIQVHSDKNILYVQRGMQEIDGIHNKLLLPLKKTKILTDWLFQNIPILIKNSAKVEVKEESLTDLNDKSSKETSTPQPKKKSKGQYAKRLTKSTKQGLAQLKNTSFLKNKRS